MVFAAHVAEVVIASPDGTDRFHPAIGQALNWWNAASGRRHEIVLMPSGGGHGTAGADRLNSSAEAAQTVDSGDVFIAVFGPARRDVTQVLGAVDRAQRAGKLVLAWLLAESPSSRGLSADDQAWLGDVTHRLGEAGIVPRYLGQ